MHKNQSKISQNWLVAFCFIIVLAFSVSADVGKVAADEDDSTAKKDTNFATLMGLQMSEEGTSVPLEKTLSVIFIFMNKPSTFFYYSPEKGEPRIVFDFYNSQRDTTGTFQDIKAGPFTKSSVEQLKRNINEDVKGLAPEWKDFVRVSLFTPYAFDFTALEEYNTIVMKFRWSTDPSTHKLARRSKWWKWPAILSPVGVATGILIYYLIAPPDTGSGCAGINCFDPPVRP